MEGKYSEILKKKKKEESPKKSPDQVKYSEILQKKKKEENPQKSPDQEEKPKTISKIDVEKSNPKQNANIKIEKSEGGTIWKVIGRRNTIKKKEENPQKRPDQEEKPKINVKKFDPKHNANIKIEKSMEVKDSKTIKKDNKRRNPSNKSGSRGETKKDKVEKRPDEDQEEERNESLGIDDVIHLFMDAIERGDLNKVKEYSSRYFSEIYYFEYDYNPLHFAAQRGRLDIAKFLISKGLKSNSIDSRGSSPLMEASWFGRADIVKFFLDRRAKINQQNKKKRTALHEAVIANQEEIVKILIERGANLNIKDEDNMTPLEKAEDFGSRDSIVELLRTASL